MLTKKIFLTGAAGFTGFFFTEQAKAAGYVVYAMAANLMDKVALAEELEKIQPDFVLHLAAISFVGHENLHEFYAVNTVGTTNLLSALAERCGGLSKVVLVSSANIYGNVNTSPIFETQVPSPVNHYAVSKLAMEYMAKTYLDRLPIVIARPFNYTGLGQSPHFIIPKLVRHYVERLGFVELGNMDVEREFNDVRTVCDVYRTLLEHGQPGDAYNVCSGKTYSLQQVMNLLTQLTGHRVQPRVNPTFVRENEVRRLCGDPDKLKRLCQTKNIIFPDLNLPDTLSWMLQKVKN